MNSNNQQDTLKLHTCIFMYKSLIFLVYLNTISNGVYNFENYATIFPIQKKLGHKLHKQLLKWCH